MRLSEFEIPVLARVIPGSLITEVLRESERMTKRARKLPAELVTWLVIGMGLFRSLSIDSVLDRVAGALGMKSWGNAEAPCTTSITQARDRLGWEAVRLLFTRLSSLLRSRFEKAILWHGHPVFTLDATCCLVPDSPENETWFGRPKCARGGYSGYPQLRLLMLVGVWTHLIAEAVVGPYVQSEMQLAESLLERLVPGSILLLDRAYFSFRWAALFSLRKTHFIVRMKQGSHVYRVKEGRSLGKGDRLCTMNRPKHLRRDPGGLPDRVSARMVTCKRQGFRPVVIITDLVEPAVYSAQELAALYRDRWEAELCYRELKVQLAGKRVTFRSRTPSRVLQEVYGLFIAYNCTRAVMCEAADWAEVRPTRLSFIASLNELRTAIETGTKLEALVPSLAHCLLPERRVGRTCVRAVKLKLTSNFPRKRKDRPVAGSPYTNRARLRQAPQRQGRQTQRRQALAS